MKYTLHNSDNLEVLRSFPDNSIDSIVTDPPYGLSFMGKHWDYDVPKIDIWKECCRVLKPGGHLLSFFGTRTYHRGVVPIEDAGFEIRDCIQWIYGSGFPKSMNISKQIDKDAGAERRVVGYDASRARPNRLYKSGAIGNVGDSGNVCDRTDNGATLTEPATEDAIKWDGWGTALKPACELIVLARKPLEGTVAANVLKWGTGGINIDKCRIPAEKTTGWGGKAAGGNTWNESNCELAKDGTARPVEGRFAANVIHDGSEEVLELFPESKGQQGDLKNHSKERQSPNGCFGKMAPAVDHPARNDSGSAARFFYCAKTSKLDREEGCDSLPDTKSGMSNGAQIHGEGYDKGQGIGLKVVKVRKNCHPTVKPTQLMRYLCKLITPPNGVVLDPFMGSGSTGKAAILEGFSFIGCELEKDYVAIATQRCEWAMKEYENSKKGS